MQLHYSPFILWNLQISEWSIADITVFLLQILDPAYVIFLITIGGFFGSVAKRDGRNEKIKILLGISTAFIAVPFTASFVKLDYSSLQLSMLGQDIDNGTKLVFSKFIEHSLMLISISGLSSYIGSAMLDNLASKVIQQDLEKVKQDVDDENKKMTREVDRLKAKMNFMRLNNLKEDSSEAKECCDDAIKILAKYNNPSQDYELMVLRGCFLKRLKRYQDAIDILKRLNEYRKTPVVTYNIACYEFLLSKEKSSVDIDKIKKMILESIKQPCTGADKEVQDRMRLKIINNTDPDLKDLFNEEERKTIGDNA